MTRLLWEISFRWKQVTPAGMLLAALFLLALLLDPLVIRPLSLHLSHAQAQQVEQQKHADEDANFLRAKSTRLRTALGDLLQLLPETSRREATLQVPESIAKQHGLKWTRTDYRVDTENAQLPQIERVVMRSTLEGSYPAMRAFLAQLLAEMPNAAIDTLSFNNATSTTPSSLGLDISLYFRRGGQASTDIAQGVRP